MTQTQSSITDRITIHPRDGRFYLAREREHIPLPFNKNKGLTVDSNIYLELAAKVDNTLNAYDKLVGKENNYVIPTGIINERKGEIAIRYSNMEKYFFVRDSYSPIFDRNPWKLLEVAPSLGRVHYFNNNNVVIENAPEMTNISNMLLGEPVSPTQTDTEFELFIEKIIEAIDNLFIQEGFQPTIQMRSNLLSLTQNMTGELIVNEKIHTLLNATLSSHRIDNPQLVKLAAKGVHDTMLKIFYAHDTYPESVEEMLGLANLPFELFHSIWTGNR